MTYCNYLTSMKSFFNQRLSRHLTRLIIKTSNKTSHNFSTSAVYDILHQRLTDQKRKVNGVRVIIIQNTINYLHFKTFQRNLFTEHLNNSQQCTMIHVCLSSNKLFTVNIYCPGNKQMIHLSIRHSSAHLISSMYVFKQNQLIFFIKHRATCS